MKSRTIEGKRVWRSEPVDQRALARAVEVLNDFAHIAKDEAAGVLAKSVEEMAKKYAPPVSTRKAKS